MARLIIAIVSWYIGLGIASTVIVVVCLSLMVTWMSDVKIGEAVLRVTTFVAVRGMLIWTFIWPAIWIDFFRGFREQAQKSIPEQSREYDEMVKDILEHS